MLIQSVEVESLNNLPWVAIDFFVSQKASIESRVEEIVLHLVKWSRTNLRDQPFQMLFPIKARTPDGISLFSPYLWARTLDLKALRGVRTVPGIEGLISESDGSPIPVEDSFVQGLIQKDREFAEAWSAGIEVGSFVRVLMGSQRMLCGKVLARSASDATVLIGLRSRTIKLKVPVLALQHLGSKVKEYFYKEN